MKTQNRPFLDEGIEHYTDACRTIGAFQRMMGDVLDNACRSRANWHPLSAYQFGRIEICPFTSEYGYWICGSINGKSPSDTKAVIDCGFWWDSEHVSEPAIIYAGYYLQPKDVMGFTWDGKSSDIRSFRAWDRTFLYLPLRKLEGIEDSLNCLIDALLKQLK
jgi:hypothetical protein